jgi:hypothetical protein
MLWIADMFRLLFRRRKSILHLTAEPKNLKELSFINKLYDSRYLNFIFTQVEKYDMTKEELQRLLDFYNEELEKNKKLLMNTAKLKGIKNIQNKINFYNEKIKELSFMT